MFIVQTSSISNFITSPHPGYMFDNVPLLQLHKLLNCSGILTKCCSVELLTVS